MSELALRMVGVNKVFPGVKALDDIHFEVEKGEIHALIGENGAGKSTLIKILAGIYQPDGGEIFIDGKPVKMDNVITARAHGISVIHQELSLAKNMTVAENIFMGKFPSKSKYFVDDSGMMEETAKLLKLIGMDELQPDTPVSRLSVAQQQMVEICRSLSEEIKILVMDEPTASLATAEVERLMDIMRMLKKKGVTIIFISHKLNEIFEICDRITVMRDGQYIGTRVTKELPYEELINMMVGRDIQNVYPPHKTNPGEMLLEANHINSDRVFDASFKLRKGEVLGFYGLMGAGRSELMRALLGIDKSTKESVILDGKKIVINNPTEATQEGIVLAPEDRKYEGLILKQTVGFNITLPILSRIIKGIKLDKKLNDETIENIGKRLRIKTPSYDAKVVNLSGGNQQKVVLAKWLVTNPKVLILDEPTRGIDVGAKQEIYKLIYEIVEMGVGVILISSEMPEVMNLCDRIYVLREGKITGEIARDEITEQTIMQYAIGGIES
ncbi:sugar ABC transporter ATP-binding protein [Lacrimispora sp. NSJ-141]|uniref:Sugar ABC transporter ATP-binding protein n=1 Tax=Lientehia hominis TaxID=2897778 RepID=A0AAP2RHS0_9FIRM|nr:sugar ABC transporter ATP-binding protein [Lientehia hominis]MCD2491900.1 sugar ABC transporter ATP-binding protein [Lientehia hominis]